MPLELLGYRFSSGPESTLGLLFELGTRAPAAPPATGLQAAIDDRRFLCFLLEDQWRAEKVSRETRIPAGRYRLRIRKYGGFHDRYAARFPEIHVGMLEVVDVPGFTDILFHCGVDDDHTAGCLLTGDVAIQNVSQRGSIGSSADAYRRIYPPIALAAASEGGAFVTLQDFA
jgi:hypothetical protein